MTRNESRRGVVLVAVLWTIALLSALAMAASTTFRGYVGIMAVDRDRVQADALLTGGLEAAAGIVTARNDAPLADIRTTVGLSTGTVGLRITDETGRIDIGKAPAAVLVSLFRSVGATPADASAMADQIVALRGNAATDGAAPPTPAVPGAAAAAATDQKSTERPFADTRQLANLPGMRAEWADALMPLITVYGGEAVNPLTASPAVLAAMPGVGPAMVRTVLNARRDISDPARLIAMLGPAGRYFAPASRGAVSVELAARLTDGYQTAAEAVFVVLSGDREPYRVLVWTPATTSTTRPEH